MKEKKKKIEVLKKVRIFFGLKQKKLIGFGQVSSNLFIERMHLLKKKERKKIQNKPKSQDLNRDLVIIFLLIFGPTISFVEISRLCTFFWTRNKHVSETIKQSSDCDE